MPEWPGLQPIGRPISGLARWEHCLGIVIWARIDLMLVIVGKEMSALVLLASRSMSATIHAVGDDPVGLMSTTKHISVTELASIPMG